MSSTTVTTSPTTVNIGLLGPNTVALGADDLTAVTVNIGVALVSGNEIDGSTGSTVTIDNAVALLSTLQLNTDGADFILQSNLLSADALSGTSVEINDGGTFQTAATLISAHVLSNADISFGTGGGTDLITNAGTNLPLDLLDSMSPIEGFTASSDIIDDQALNYDAITGYSISGTIGGTETVTVLTSDGSNLTFGVAGGTFATGSYALGTGPLDLTDKDGGLQITVCYLAGTRILTAGGERPIEDLRIGDEVATRFGGMQRIRWIGRQSFGRRFVRRNRARIPVRIRAGALGGDLPRRDLFVSPGHSMLLGETLILARNLVNGVTITQDAPPETLQYVQLEFGAHDCVLAEGAWSESYADAPGMRAAFHNAAEFAQLYPDHVPATELRLCAPRLEAGPALDAALRPIVARAAALVRPGRLLGWVEEVTRHGYIRGWAMDEATPELPVLLEVLCEGKVVHRLLACDYRGDLAEAGLGQGRCAFALYLPGDGPWPVADLTIRRAADGSALPPTEAFVERLSA